ncbi:MAG: GNAT family N-acetyltransferase [Polyangiaceae bacterium]|nr:GNAT family N-acetyltransferase [Polyangiaceae bacterium]
MTERVPTSERQPTAEGAIAGLRPARDADGAGVIALLGAVFAEYPGCVLDVDGEMPELRAIATWFARAGGRFYVVERAGGDGRAPIVACVGHTPSGPDGLELRKLYVARSARRGGLGGGLCELVESIGRAAGARFVELWSDTRFLDAHRLYERRGYRRGLRTRELHDLSASVEYHFRKEL